MVSYISHRASEFYKTWPEAVLCLYSVLRCKKLRDYSLSVFQPDSLESRGVLFTPEQRFSPLLIAYVVLACPDSFLDLKVSYHIQFLDTYPRGGWRINQLLYTMIVIQLRVHVTAPGSFHKKLFCNLCFFFFLGCVPCTYSVSAIGGKPEYKGAY